MVRRRPKKSVPPALHVRDTRLFPTQQPGRSGTPRAAVDTAMVWSCLGVHVRERAARDPRDQTTASTAVADGVGGSQP